MKLSLYRLQYTKQFIVRLCHIQIVQSIHSPYIYNITQIIYTFILFIILFQGHAEQVNYTLHFSEKGINMSLKPDYEVLELIS